MIGNLALADQVFRARNLIGKHCGDQVFRSHALQLWRDFLATAKARQCQRDSRVPAPARGEHGRGEQGLHQHIAHAVGMQIALHFFQRKTVAGGER